MLLLARMVTPVFPIALLCLVLDRAYAIGSMRPCNSSELFDVLLRDFWLLQFGPSYLGGQLPDTESSYALAVASCKVYSTQFDKHRFLIQSCFQAGEFKAVTLQHRMAGLCNPLVLETLKPNLACLRNVYSSRSYDVCMASALQLLSANIRSHNSTVMRYSDSPYHCVNVRQSVMCSQHAMDMHCDEEQLNSTRTMFDTVWMNNAIVEGHYECPIKPLFPFARRTPVKEDPFNADRRRVHAFCRASAQTTSEPLIVAISSYPNQIVRELLLEERSPILPNITARLSSYMQCARVALFATHVGGRGTSFSPMHDWMSVLESFLAIGQDLRRAVINNQTCGSLLLSHQESTPCYQCVDKLTPSFPLSDYRYNRFSLPAYVDAIVHDDDPLAFCRATISVIKFLECLIESVLRTCQIQLTDISMHVDALKIETEVTYGCPLSDPWFTDLQQMPSYDENKAQQPGAFRWNVSRFCD